LRRELASTLRESGAPDHIVADALGHANISTTSRYLKASRAGLTIYLQRFEQHRKQQQVAAKKAAKKGIRQDSHIIRTRGPEGRSGKAGTAVNPG
jgi:predicted transcriptional regulator